MKISGLPPELQRLIQDVTGNEDSALAAVKKQDEPLSLTPLQLEAQIMQLQETAGKFNSKEDLKEGDVVVFKPGLKNSRFPKYGQPAIVMSTTVPAYQLPLYDDMSNQTGCDRPDIVLGVLNECNHFVRFAFDSRRFTKVPTPTAN